MIIEMQPAMKAAIAGYIRDVLERRAGSHGGKPSRFTDLAAMFEDEAKWQFAAAEREMSLAIAQAEASRGLTPAEAVANELKDAG